LAEIVKKVYTMEIIEPLGKQAAARLKNLNYKNIEVKIADGYDGWKEHAPYDAIIVTAAAEYIPPPLKEPVKGRRPHDHPCRFSLCDAATDADRKKRQ
jgi:protein-L-isoaspartate(D-aspartate) O-methyltransferase